jgi:putative endonuclease
LGDFGEQVAAAYLTRRGYRLLGRKWRGAGGEIDLVMQDGTTLVFIEVRTRRGAPFGAAIESVGAAKQARLAALGHAYAAWAAVPEDQPWRIDVVAIQLDPTGRVVQVEHIRDAVEQQI